MSKIKEKPIVGFFDAICPKCGKRFGWHGGIIDRPACSRCGHNITPEETKDVEKSVRQLNVFRVIQKLFHECRKCMSQTELAFIKNMYDKHRRKNRKAYDEVQKRSIQRIATKYDVLD